MADEQPGMPRPKSTVMTYATPGYLDPWKLGEICEKVGVLVNCGMPGASIRKIGYDGHLLTIELAE